MGSQLDGSDLTDVRTPLSVGIGAYPNFHERSMQVPDDISIIILKDHFSIAKKRSDDRPFGSRCTKTSVISRKISFIAKYNMAIN
jgi:hypothetical protein